MMDWTPTTEDVRAVYNHDEFGEPAAPGDLCPEFDRWLAQVKAEAWDEGFRICDAVWVETADIVTPDEYRTDPSNPYRNGQS